MQTDKNICQDRSEGDENRDRDNTDCHGRARSIVEVNGKKNEVDNPEGDCYNKDPDKENAEDLGREDGFVRDRAWLVVAHKTIVLPQVFRETGKNRANLTDSRGKKNQCCK